MPHDWRRDRAGPPATTAISPHPWCGESDGLIGPFANARTANAFTGAGPAGEAYETYRFRIVRTAEGLYLEVTHRQAPVGEPSTTSLPHVRNRGTETTRPNADRDKGPS